jgi:hypothetical protein
MCCLIYAIVLFSALASYFHKGQNIIQETIQVFITSTFTFKCLIHLELLLMYV